MAHDWTSPETDLFDHVEGVLAANGEGVLATIVDVEGNAYRRPGAKMLVEGNRSIGSVTAGCLEDEVLTLAQSVLEDGMPRVETFDLMEDDDVWGLGMGCHGIIDVLLEPIAAGVRSAVDAYQERASIAAITVLESADPDVSQFERIFYRPGDGFVGIDGTAEDSAPGWRVGDGASLKDTLPAGFEPTVESILADGDSRTVELETPDGSITVFVDGIRPPPELVVVGAGPDVDPVVELAHQNDFRVTVVGYRGAQIDSERFPSSDVHSTSPRSIRSCHEFDEGTYVVAVTHNYVDDRLTVEAMLETSVPYVAVVGARERAERIVDELREEELLEPGDRDRIYAPAGLDLGGGSPNQIATSIVAEVLAVHNDCVADPLRSREGPIHPRGPENEVQ